MFHVERNTLYELVNYNCVCAFHFNTEFNIEKHLERIYNIFKNVF